MTTKNNGDNGGVRSGTGQVEIAIEADDELRLIVRRRAASGSMTNIYDHTFSPVYKRQQRSGSRRTHSGQGEKRKTKRRTQHVMAAGKEKPAAIASTAGFAGSKKIFGLRARNIDFRHATLI